MGWCIVLPGHLILGHVIPIFVLSRTSDPAVPRIPGITYPR